jgi:hypothetical protein
MKKILLLIVLGTFFLTGAAHAKIHEMVKQVDDLKVKISMDMEKHNKSGHNGSGEMSHHNAMGGNDFNIAVYDQEEKPVTDAKVKVGYSMPSTDNMPPMNYTARAKRAGDQYGAKLNLSMKGKWDVMIYIKRPKKPLSKVDFSVHVE